MGKQEQNVCEMLGAALLAAGLGFSPELGAFLAGFVLAGTPFRHQLSGQLIPMRDLFMAVFFTAVGLRLDPSVIADGWVLIVVATLGLVLVKPLVMLVVAWVLRLQALHKAPLRPIPALLLLHRTAALSVIGIWGPLVFSVSDMASAMVFALKSKASINIIALIPQPPSVVLSPGLATRPLMGSWPTSFMILTFG